jgi:hypothetical protein
MTSPIFLPNQLESSSSALTHRAAIIVTGDSGLWRSGTWLPVIDLRVTLGETALTVSMTEDDVIGSSVTSARVVNDSKRPSLWSRLATLRVSIKDEDLARLPTDAARNLDKYLYGASPR